MTKFDLAARVAGVLDGNFTFLVLWRGGGGWRVCADCYFADSGRTVSCRPEQTVAETR
jgi:hypothetical protein